ncbi:VOC family protein [Halomonas nitroreducens]|uniref:VOC family protein n=1 Tax=Halomonas nitroreducens TaxID=447425 RepID=A0A3S0K5W8_9GAMM|nr:VOC family protein [Halomonas nitroreducens]RTR06560.1 VOC family protein [Halomonas nitroreducens]
MLPIRGIDHLVLRICDEQRMLAFYCEVLGCTLEKRQDALGLIQLRAGDALIDLVPVEGPLGRRGGPPPDRDGHNLDHFCLRLAPFDEAAIRRHLAAHGVEVGETKPRYGAEGTGPSLHLQDPDGNTLELKGPPDA